jgi:hypothetical protein
MALSKITLKVARSDLRSRIAEISDKKVTDDELNRWLNVGQQAVAARLGEVIGHWYGGKTTSAALTLVDGGILEHTLVSPYDQDDIMKIDAVVGNAGADVLGKVFVPANSLEDIYKMKDNSSFTNTFAWLHHGATVLLFVGDGATALSPTTDKVDIFYTKKPTDMTSPTASYVDVPGEYVDLVIMVAQSIAMGKLNLLDAKRVVEQSVNQTMNDILQQYQVGVQQLQLENLPGEQTPFRSR